MTTAEILTIIGMFLTVSGALVVMFLNLNIKNTETATKVLQLEKEFNEHKNENKDSFTGIQTLFKENRNENREEHKEMTEKLAEFTTSLTDFTHTIIHNLK